MVYSLHLMVLLSEVLGGLSPLLAMSDSLMDYFQVVSSSSVCGACMSMCICTRVCTCMYMCVCVRARVLVHRRWLSCLD